MALKEYKKAFEETYAADWDDDSVGELQNTAFADDAGAAGTFARTLSEVTTDSVPLIAVYGGVTVVMSALFFVSLDCVASRVVLVVLGSMFAILGCFAALALSVICGISLNVVHFWTMPFIIIGIGIDDMFMMALSSQTVEAGRAKQAFAQAFANVAVPITMTSLVNAAMFAIMSFCSDIRAVYHAGYTGLMATVILHLTMLLSFSALVYLDSQRQVAARYDCLPCLKPSAHQEVAKPALSSFIYAKMYRPAMTSWVGRSLTLLASLALIIAAAVGLADLPIGLDLQDFFPAGTSAGKFAQDRHRYFPSWPVTLN
jgi:predicted RND superfamily exporter protein